MIEWPALSTALAVKWTGEDCDSVSVGEVTVTQMPLQAPTVRVRVCDPKAPVESQARTITERVPALIVTGALIDVVGPEVFQAATLST